MKKYLIVVTILALISCQSYFAQSIGFGHPQNNAVYASTASGSTSTTVPVSIQYGFTLTPYPPAVSVSNYVKLNAEGTTYTDLPGQTPGIPSSLNLSAGSHTWTLELWELYLGGSSYRKTATASVTFSVKFIISAVNNFSGGSIGFEGSTVPVNAASTQKFIGESVAVGAVDQTNGNYNMVWNTSGTNNSIWQRNGQSIYGATSRNYSYTIAGNDNGAILTANLRKICTATTQNRAGSVNIGSSSQNQVVESNPLNLSATTYFTSNEVNFTFQNWTWSGGSNSSSSMTVYPTDNTTYYANYSGTATSAYTMNVHFTSSNG